MWSPAEGFMWVVVRFFFGGRFTCALNYLVFFFFRGKKVVFFLFLVKNYCREKRNCYFCKPMKKYASPKWEANGLLLSKIQLKKLYN